MSATIDEAGSDGARPASPIEAPTVEALNPTGNIATRSAPEPIEGPAIGRPEPIEPGATGNIATGLTAAAHAELRKLTEDMLSEGVLDALGAALQGASAEDVKALYNRAGQARMAELIIEPFEIEHPALGTVRTGRFLGRMEDGSAIEIIDAFNQSLQLYGTAKRLGLYLPGGSAPQVSVACIGSDGS